MQKAAEDSKKDQNEIQQWHMLIAEMRESYATAIHQILKADNIVASHSLQNPANTRPKQTKELS